MKKYILVILPLLVMSLAGCEQKQEPKPDMVKEVYINHDIALCGIDDPAENHKGVKERIDYYLDLIEKNSQEKVDVTIGIFEDSIGNQTWIRYGISYGYGDYYYRGVVVYSCDDLLFGGEWSNPFSYDSSYTAISSEMKTSYGPPAPCNECDEFFKNNKLVGIIAHIIYLPKDEVTNN